MNRTAIPQQAAASRSRSPYTITVALIAINVLVFLAMVASGVSLTQPTPRDILLWGGDFGPATVGAHQWWRLPHLLLPALRHHPHRDEHVRALSHRAVH